MKRPACQSILGRLLVAVVTLGLSGVGNSAAAQSAGDLDVQVQVVPATAEPSPTEPAPAGILPAGIDPAGFRLGPTVSASITGVDAMTPIGDADSAALDLVVADGRQNGTGWIVKLMRAPEARPDDPIVISRYLRSAEPIAAQSIRGAVDPRGNRFALGQPLHRMTPVITAPPGSGAGVYWIRFAVSGPHHADDVATPLIIAISTAP